MGIKNNKLIKFNSTSLLNKREIIESFEDFIKHHKKKNNEEGYSEGRRKAILKLCNEFLKKLYNSQIPSIVKPWYYYSYTLTRDSIRLDLLKCEKFEIDDDGFEEREDVVEQTVLEEKCHYLTVAQYAIKANVSDTTVRQWIRRGKLRSAKKLGRSWFIPALAETPSRGYDNVSYYYQKLSDDILTKFDFLKNTTSIYIKQDEDNKCIYHIITNLASQDKIVLSTQDRERLELLLLAMPDVYYEEDRDCIQYAPAKHDISLPLLEKKSISKRIECNTLFIELNKENICFPPNSEVGNILGNNDPHEYILPISWTIWGSKENDEDIFDNALSGDFSKCNRIGSLNGHLILYEEIVRNDLNPVLLCGNISEDLGYIMTLLCASNRPLNKNIGDVNETIFYIDELIIEENFRRYEYGSRILREMPYMCKKAMHIKPTILAYYVNKNINAENYKMIRGFYIKNGFKSLEEKNILYAYTE